MKRSLSIWICMIVISFAGVAAADEQPEATGTTLAAAEVATSASAFTEEKKEGSGYEAYCVADCGEYSDVSCTGNTCNAANRNCSSGQRGFVVCDGVYTFCPACPECVEDDFQIVRTGSCCQEGAEETEIYRCINEQWVLQSTGCFPSPACPILP